MDPTLRCEIFHDGTTTTGVLLRRRTGVGLATLTCLRAPDGPLVHIRSHVAFDADVFGWSRYSYAERGGTSVDVRREDLAEDDQRLIPSYAEYLLLADVGAGRGMPVGYRRLRDAAPEAPAVPAEVRPGASDDVVLSDGELRRCARVDVTESGEVASTHWFYGTAMVASDWQGARTFLVPDLEAALADATPAVRSAATEWARSRSAA